MVHAQYRLVTEHLGERRLLCMGNSSGGMQLGCGEDIPGFHGALVPMASMPIQVAGRNWITRRIIIELIRSDPEWNGGNYTKQPRSLHWQRLFLVSPPAAATGGSEGGSNQGKSRSTGEPTPGATIESRRQRMIYQYESSRDYNPAPKLESIKARLLAINSADDERNPPELGIMEREISASRKANIS